MHKINLFLIRTVEYIYRYYLTDIFVIIFYIFLNNDFDKVFIPRNNNCDHNDECFIEMMLFIYFLLNIKKTIFLKNYQIIYLFIGE